MHVLVIYHRKKKQFENERSRVTGMYYIILYASSILRLY